MATEITIINPDVHGTLSGKFNTNIYHHTLSHIKTKKAQEAIKNRFNQYEGNYNLIFHNMEDKTNIYAKNHISKTYPSYLLNGYTNVIITSNFGPNSLPFTPWITTHRMVHAFHNPLIRENIEYFHDFIPKKIHQFLDELNEFVLYALAWDLPTRSGIMYDAILSTGNKKNIYLMSTVFKGKSGRANVLHNELDFVAEVFTYFMYYKKVEFNRIPEEIIPECRRNVPLVMDTFKKLNDRMSFHEEEITKEMQRVFEDIQGKTFIF